MAASGFVCLHQGACQLEQGFPAPNGAVFMNSKSFSLASVLILTTPALVMAASLSPNAVDCFFNCETQKPIAEIAPAPESESLFNNDGPSLFGSDTQYWGDLTPDSPAKQTSDPLFAPFGTPDLTPSER